MNQVTISAVIPLYNGEKFIREAIESALMQTGVKADEIVVVDDGSKDEGAKIAQTFGKKVKLIRQNHSGIAAARSQGVKNANGMFIAFLDSDDIWTEDHLQKLLTPFRQNPELFMTFGKVEQFPNQKSDEVKIPDAQRVLSGFTAGSGLIRMEAFHNIGLFDANLRIGEFLEWYSRAVTEGLEWEMISDVVLKRRIHDRNTGILQKKNRNDYLRVLFEHLKRKRSTN